MDWLKRSLDHVATGYLVALGAGLFAVMVTVFFVATDVGQTLVVDIFSETSVEVTITELEDLLLRIIELLENL